MLRTFGDPVLLDEGGAPVHELRRKDLALLIYLCVTGPRRSTRTMLANLLWSETSEAHARHSLTQACRRIGNMVRGSLVTNRESLEWRGTLACDALLLEEAGSNPEALGLAAVDLYGGDFLSGFDVGRGGEEFGIWADGKRAELRSQALRLIDRLGQDAEQRGAWPEALRLGERAVAIEPIFEEGHRRIMRSWHAQGERGLALVQYHRFANWIARELDAVPDARTDRLMETIRDEGRPAGDVVAERGVAHDAGVLPSAWVREPGDGPGARDRQRNVATTMYDRGKRVH